MEEDFSWYIKDKIQKYSLSDIRFTKDKLLGWLENRNRASIEKLRDEIYHSKGFVFAAKQTVEFRGETEIRYRCYHIFSGSSGRCFIISFNSYVNVITAFPLGRTTISRYTV